MTVLNIIRDCLDALLHPSARYDALTRARHRAFIAPRLLGSLAAFAAFPVYLAMRGAPTALEVAAFAWLIAPILLSWFLSRTGRYEGAHVLSSLAMAGMVMTLAMKTGGIESFAAIWLVVVPLEAALSASRRVVVFASAAGAGMRRAADRVSGISTCCRRRMSIAALRGILMAFGVASATLYAAGLAFGAESLARTSVSLLNVEEDRYRLLARNMSDVISRHRRNGAVQFISPAVGDDVGDAGRAAAWARPVRPRPCRRSSGLSHRAFGRGARRRGAQRRISSADATRRAAASAVRTIQVDFIWVEMRCRPLERPSQTDDSA